MSDDTSSFGLGRVRRGIRNRYEELAHDTSPESKSIGHYDDIPGGRYVVETTTYDRRKPPDDDMAKYWRQFETTPIVRKPITSFASRVVEPGYYFEFPDELSDDKELHREIRHFAQSCAIVEGEKNQDFSTLARKSIVQNEVRGTSFHEVVPDRNDSDVVAGLKLINAETMEAVTYPNQAILLEPDATERDELEGVPTTDDGEAAAYLQDLFETRNTVVDYRASGSDNEENKVPFTQDEIIRLTRDADVGEIFGTSRLEAVSDRIEGIRQKLCDNDEAIASKAYPLWLFMFGDPDSDVGVWDSDVIQNFMSHHEMDKFHPGMKQGVRGDVSVETISGEVADIADSLEFDVNWIMSAMPMPKYALGGFGESVGQVAGVAQQSDVQRQINDMRQEIERKFSPVFQRKAMEHGVDEELARDIHIRIGDPNRPDVDPNSNQQIIRYMGKDSGGVEGIRDMSQNLPDVRDNADDGRGSPQTASSDERDQSPSSDEESSDGESEQSSDEPFDPRHFENDDTVWDHEFSVAELAHYDSTSHEAELAVTISNVTTRARNNVLDRVGEEDIDIERIANREIERVTQKNSFKNTASGSVDESLREAEKLYDGANLTARYSLKSRFERNIQNAVKDFLEQMMRRIRLQVRRGRKNGEDFAEVKERVYNEFSDSDIYNRAQLIAQMECRECRESAKMELFEQDDDIVGIRFPEGEHSHDVCQVLAGTEHRFEDDVLESMRTATNSVKLDDSFDPLPLVPPFHYDCTMSMEPLYDESENSKHMEDDTHE